METDGAAVDLGAEIESAHTTDRKSARNQRIELITRGERRRRCVHRPGEDLQAGAALAATVRRDLWMLLSLLERQQRSCDGNGKDHVWLELRCSFKQGAPVSHTAYNFEVGFQKLTECLHKDSMIVGQHDSRQCHEFTRLHSKEARLRRTL